MPLGFGEEYQQILSDEFSEELDGQYNVFVLSEETEDRKIKFEVHGVPNSPASEAPTYDSGSHKVGINPELLRNYKEAKEAQDTLNEQWAQEDERKKNEILPLTDWEVNELRYILKSFARPQKDRMNIPKEPVTI